MKPKLFNALKSRALEYRIIASERESEINFEKLKADKIPSFIKIFVPVITMT